MSIIHIKPDEAQRHHSKNHEGYEYYRRNLTQSEKATQCKVGMYEIPPQKSAYPYHYHLKNEEVFYILSGEGILKSPEGEKKVTAGDFLFFPADETGAHKLTNSSDTEMLVYLDFDTSNDIDITFYPDSEKIGIWGKNTNQLYKTETKVDYYKDE